MISVDHVRLMARYNSWQNRSLYAAADALGDAERRKPRGAFFGSIHGTLCHILWGDRIWMSRFTGTELPPVGIKESPGMVEDWAELVRQRVAFDETIVAWTQRLDPAWLQGPLTWYSGAVGREISRPRWQLVTHFFNHQTHHRGQVHAMLTACGAKPDDTDLMLLEA